MIFVFLVLEDTGPNTNLPEHFPTDDLPPHLMPGKVNEAFNSFEGEQNLNGETALGQTLGRTMTMHSRKPLVGADTLPADSDRPISEKEKKKLKESEPPKDEYKYPGCCVSLLRLLLSFVNVCCLLLGLILIGYGLYGQIRFRMGSSRMDLATDPTFILLITGLVVTVTSFNGTLGFFRGNLLMLKFFGWILVLLFLAIFIGGITLLATFEQLTGSLEASYKDWIKLGFRGNKPNLAISGAVNHIQTIFR